ncbi:GNAT family N-acetyltransferase [Rhabdochlamydiaceae symbiont of Dictyostelium giganteum]|uniref:GNAT family N-acetyltransferase n=1 Tax=Rhabdochlamydiaceae symbiont of Dictyostelium giganteum TaxID=3342349 RepID=UPI00384EE982
MQSLKNEPIEDSRISFQLNYNHFQVEIETERLFIRSYKSEDFQKYVQLYGDAAITKYFDHGKPKTKFEVNTLISQKGAAFFIQGKPFGFFSIFNKDGLDFIGQIDFLPTEEPGVFEIGYILHEKYHNRGFCTEALKAIIINYTRSINSLGYFKEFSVLKIMATVHPENLPSKRVLEKMGLSLNKSQERFGKPRLWYSLILNF